MTDSPIVQVAKQLEATLSANPALQKPAEQFLAAAEKQPGFTGVLLELCANAQAAAPVRQAAAICFKNVMIRNWDNDDNEVMVPNAADREAVKKHLLSVLLQTPTQVRSQLAMALTYISQFEFPQRWESLLPELVRRLQTDDLHVVAGVLETSTFVFDRYRFESATNELLREIKYVVVNFGPPLLATFQRTCAAIEANIQNGPVLQQLFLILRHVTRVFFLLNTQDIPEYFEDAMTHWMSPLRVLLNFTNPLLVGKDQETPGLLEYVKENILRSLDLYVTRYEEEFKAFVPTFVEDTWKLLTSLDKSERYDGVVTTGIKFLTSVVRTQRHAELFASEQKLRAMCEAIIIPQLHLRESDLELFRWDGLEYLRRDIEKSDSDTRRRMAVDFVRGIMHHFQAEISGILKSYVIQLLARYKENPQANWMSKDAAMYIMIAATVLGETARRGVTKINQFIDIVEFFRTEVLPELQSPVDALPVLKADAIKFVSTFRQQLPPDSFGPVLELLVKHLESPEFVVHTYAAGAIEKLLNIVDPDTAAPRVTPEMLQPMLKQLLGSLFGAINKHEDSHENKYLMKAILRVTAVAKHLMSAVAGDVIAAITAILSRVAQNPRNPYFNHYAFEVLAAMIKYICAADKSAVGNFESALYPVLDSMLEMESCVEFGTYVFQIRSQLLMLQPGGVTERYRAMFPTVLQPKNWQQDGWVPSLTMLLRAYVRKGGDFLVQNIQGVLGVFQNLLAFKKSDHLALELITELIYSVDVAVWKQYAVEIFRLLLQRLAKKETPKYVKNLLVFFSNFVVKHGFDTMVQITNEAQKDIMAMILTRYWIPNVGSVDGVDSRRLVAVAMTDILCKSEAMVTVPAFQSIWAQFAGTAALFIQGKEDDSAATDLAVDEEWSAEQINFKTSVAPLNYGSLPPIEQVPKSIEPEKYFPAGLAQVTAKMPGVLTPLLEAQPEKARKAIDLCLKQAQVQLS